MPKFGHAFLILLLVTAACSGQGPSASSRNGASSPPTGDAQGVNSGNNLKNSESGGISSGGVKPPVVVGGPATSSNQVASTAPSNPVSPIGSAIGIGATTSAAGSPLCQRSYADGRVCLISTNVVTMSPDGNVTDASSLVRISNAVHFTTELPEASAVVAAIAQLGTTTAGSPAPAAHTAGDSCQSVTASGQTLYYALPAGSAPALKALLDANCVVQY